MKVKELIKELRKQPNNQEVVVSLDGFATTHIEVKEGTGLDDGHVLIEEA